MSGSQTNKINPHLILPVGTQVVTLVEVRAKNGQPLRRSGAVGKIVKSPLDNDHAYTVQFPAVSSFPPLHRIPYAVPAAKH